MKKEIGRIYSLTDPMTNHIRYIGQTRLDIEMRLKNHFKDRQQNKNKNNHNANWLSKLWRENKIKPIVKLIEEGIWSDEKLNERELYWINYYLNLGLDLTNTSLNSQFRFKGWKRFQTGKTIYCYDRNFIEKKFINARQAGEIKDFCYKKISNSAVNQVAYNNLLFSFIELNREEIQKRFDKYNLQNRKIIARNIDTNKEIIFNTQMEASKELNLNLKNISLCLKKQRRSCGGYFWQYENEEFIFKPKIKKVMYIPTEQVFNSVKECSQILGMTDKQIRSNIFYNGNNLKFKYVD